MRKNKKNSRPLDRRRSVRHFFGGAAELTEIASGNYVVGMVTQLSRNGCFVRTTQPFLTDTNVKLQITHNRTALVLQGRVVQTKQTGGIAVSFEALLPMTEALLEEWLNETNGRGSNGRR